MMEKMVTKSVRSWACSRYIRILIVFCISYLIWTNTSATQKAASLTKAIDSTFHRHVDDSPRIAIVTMVTSQKSYMHLSLKNKAYYAQKHGYDFYTDYQSNDTRGIKWHKLEMVENLIRKGNHDWIWWLDFDTLITNTAVMLESIITEALMKTQSPDMVDILTTDDCNGLNSGSFIARSSEGTLDFITRVRNFHDRAALKGSKFGDQQSMRLFIDTRDPERKRAVRVPQIQLNAYPKEIPCYENPSSEWQPGLFVIHFPGASAIIKSEDPVGFLMKKYEKDVI